MFRLSTAQRIAWVVWGLAGGTAGWAQNGQDTVCILCYSCGQHLSYADQFFHPSWGAGYVAATPGAAVAAHVAAHKAAQPRSYCSYDVALDGSKYPLYLHGQLIGHVYGATEFWSSRVFPINTDKPCEPEVRLPYSFGQEGAIWANNAAICSVPSTPATAITLDGPAETKPRSTSGWRELMLTARVMQGTTPVAGKAVTFKLTAKAAPDGHEHGELASKPAGSVANVATNETGEYKVPYLPSEFAGVYAIEASCDGCGGTAKLDVTVRVPDLVEMTASTRQPPAYALIGQTTAHPRNHYFSVTGLKALMGLVDTMRSLDWSNPGINDSSLVWGGRFDIAGRWGGSHAGHRDGDEVDISFYRPRGVTQDIRNKTYDTMAKEKQFTAPQVLWHQNDNPDTGSSAHFHIYLLGQKASFKTRY